MARVNFRPDIIYIKDMSEQDKDNFETIINSFNMTNNGDAIKKLMRVFLDNEDLRKEQANEIARLNSELNKATKEKTAFINNADKLIKAISTVEDNLKTAKKDLSKLK